MPKKLFQKGDPRPPNSGRKPGQKNRVNLAFRDMVVNVIEKGGGEAWLLQWAKKNQTEFFKIAARLIPTELVGKFKTEHTVPEETRAALEALNKEQLQQLAHIFASVRAVADAERRADRAGREEPGRVH